MTELHAVDSVEIRILVDNATDGLSTVPPHAQTEFAGLARRGGLALAGENLCHASHGFSCLVTATRGTAKRTVLFDAGPDEESFRRNVARLDADMGAVDAVVLSHGHWDHAGGLLAALELIRKRNGGADVPLHAHDGMFVARGLETPRVFLRFGEVPSPDSLERHGARRDATETRHTLLDGTFELSGEIPRNTPFERGFPGHQRQAADGSWEPDPLLLDERALWLRVAGKGLVVFTACSHAGVVNVLQHARALHPDVPIHAVIGGFHLAGGTESIIEPTVNAMRQLDLRVVAPGHCTGWRAMGALAQALGPAVDPIAVGKRYIF
ncbi:MAG TPA: MBL fold metallo-hydrolase [Candidatus Thermoplasmatota archaeon]|nr:MBL fold metallo-hydrolase [Candidatus Thermoplasmatota archaeon]